MDLHGIYVQFIPPGIEKLFSIYHHILHDMTFFKRLSTENNGFAFPVRLFIKKMAADDIWKKIFSTPCGESMNIPTFHNFRIFRIFKL